MRRHGFLGCSPFTRPALVRLATAIPFAELAGESHEALYGLKGEVLRHGVREVLGLELPVYPKRRFQEGAVPPPAFSRRFAAEPEAYRAHFLGLHQARTGA